jgi:hypothetical protein
MKLERRISVLEARTLSEPVILRFADGSTRQICGRVDYLMNLFASACGHRDLTCGQSADLDQIRQSVPSEEPGGGHIVNLIRCFLLGPIQPSSVTPVRS